MADARPRALDERVERPHAHRQRQHHAGHPGQPAALDDRDQRARRRPEDCHVIAGHQAARLQRGTDRAGLVVDLRPGDEVGAGGRALRHDALSDEAHTVLRGLRAAGGGDEAVDDRSAFGHGIHGSGGSAARRIFGP